MDAVSSDPIARIAADRQGFRDWYTGHFQQVFGPLLDAFGPESIRITAKEYGLAEASQPGLAELAAAALKTRDAMPLPASVSDAELAAVLAAQRELDNPWVYRTDTSLLRLLHGRFGETFLAEFDRQLGLVVRPEWAAIAARQGGNAITDLIKALWEPLHGLGFAYTLETLPDGVQMRCTACPWAELGKRLDIQDWAFRQYCLADWHIVAGFNPKIGFRRGKTLMEGHDCCDHFYFMKE